MTKDVKSLLPLRPKKLEQTSIGMVTVYFLTAGWAMCLCLGDFQLRDIEVLRGGETVYIIGTRLWAS